MKRLEQSEVEELEDKGESMVVTVGSKLDVPHEFEALAVWFDDDDQPTICVTVSNLEHTDRDPLSIDYGFRVKFSELEKFFSAAEIEECRTYLEIHEEEDFSELINS
jgi:hypothetical protein